SSLPPQRSITRCVFFSFCLATHATPRVTQLCVPPPGVRCVCYSSAAAVASLSFEGALHPRAHKPPSIPGIPSLCVHALSVVLCTRTEKWCQKLCCVCGQAPSRRC
ncbi:unnamed protein product, partial [Ectocarpus sp. 13 AM-2016]